MKRCEEITPAFTAVKLGHHPLALLDGEFNDRRDTDHVMDGMERCRDVVSAAGSAGASRSSARCTSAHWQLVSLRQCTRLYAVRNLV